MNIIKQKRTELGMSQQKFSEYTEIPLRTIQDWESGRRKCPDYVLKFLIFYLENAKR